MGSSSHGRCNRQVQFLDDEHRRGRAGRVRASVRTPSLFPPPLLPIPPRPCSTRNYGINRENREQVKKKSSWQRCWWLFPLVPLAGRLDLSSMQTALLLLRWMILPRKPDGTCGY